MKIKIAYIALMTIFSMGVWSCGQGGNHGEEGHSHGEESHESSHEGHGHDEEQEGEVHLLQKQMDVMDIQLGTFKSVNLSTTIKANGRLELPPQNKASLSALMGGRVKSILVREGDFVQKGEVLAYLENPDFVEIQRSYLEDKSNFELLDLDFKRKNALFGKEVISLKDFQKIETSFMQAQAAYQASKASMIMLDMPTNSNKIASSLAIKSPISGHVRLVEINIGKYVEPQQEMFEIVDNDHIHIDLLVYEKDIDKVVVDQKVVFSLATHPEKVFEGSVFAVGKAFEEDTKAVKVHAEITSKPDGLLPGMFVDARIVTKEANKVQAVPDDAIITESGLDYIFVLKEASEENHNHEGHDHDHGGESHNQSEEAHNHEGHNHEGENGEHGDGEFIFQKIEVNTGARDIGFTEVVPAQQIGKDPKIVIKGAYYLQAEMKKGEGGHGHHH